MMNKLQYWIEFNGVKLFYKMGTGSYQEWLKITDWGHLPWFKLNVHTVKRTEMKNLWSVFQTKPEKDSFFSLSTSVLRMVVAVVVVVVVAKTVFVSIHIFSQDVLFWLRKQNCRHNWRNWKILDIDRMFQRNRQIYRVYQEFRLNLG